MILVVPNSTYEDPAAPGTAPGISAVDKQGRQLRLTSVA